MSVAIIYPLAEALMDSHKIVKKVLFSLAANIYFVHLYFCWFDIIINTVCEMYNMVGF